MHIRFIDFGLYRQPQIGKNESLHPYYKDTKFLLI